MNIKNENILNYKHFKIINERIFKMNDNTIIKKIGFSPFVATKDKTYVEQNLRFLYEHIEIIKKELPELVVPIDFYRKEKVITAYTEPFIDGVTLNDYLCDEKNTLDDKIYCLSLIGEFLERLDNFRRKHSINIFLNDLHEDNVMIDKQKKLYFVDIDSIRFEKNFTNPAKALVYNLKPGASPINYFSSKYEFSSFYDGWGFILANKNSDIYCYYIIILNFLYKDVVVDSFTYIEYSQYIKFLEGSGLNKNLINCFKSVNEKTDNLNPYKYLKHIKKYIQS